MRDNIEFCGEASQRRQPVSKIDYQALREAAEVAKEKTTWQNLQAFHAAATPEVVLALLDVLDASLEAEPVMFCISGQNVDSEEHVSTSKAIVDAWVEEWNQVDGSPGAPLYKTMPLYCHAALPAPVVPEGLVKAVRFYELVKSENPPVETGAWKDAVDWVLEEACQAVNIGIKGE
ncbi:ead/Ea22-like family protein [Escherichia coli]|uniref:ead/Ea22-like family protein n=1 Tax=Escherichia coli TaxID=562 RepID=UPI002DBFE755|nr:ead/Ea22-like family protein [Escherichia coli]MEC6647230.1 ead/Ea22-like family protein [Escherichia coli]